MGSVGQGTSPNPPSNFGNHWILKLNGRFYDPSYGIGDLPNSAAYEAVAFHGFIT
ncbi:MAG: hypothetical protein K2X00_12390 [Nitrospiraceae bacterium]|nr:hypothetical protein [Nitrospiraceae bacterium]